MLPAFNVTSIMVFNVTSIQCYQYNGIQCYRYNDIQCYRCSILPLFNVTDWQDSTGLIQWTSFQDNLSTLYQYVFVCAYWHHLRVQIHSMLYWRDWIVPSYWLHSVLASFIRFCIFHPFWVEFYWYQQQLLALTKMVLASFIRTSTCHWYRNVSFVPVLLITADWSYRSPPD